MGATEALDLTKARLEEIGFTVSLETGAIEPESAQITLRRNGHEQTLVASIAPKVTLSMISPRILDDPSGTLFITEQINEKTAAALRRSGVQFVDYAGNVHLSSPNWVIDVRSKTKPHTTIEANDLGIKKARTDNLASPKRAQVVFALLAWPKLLDATLRELSTCAGVSLGLAQSTVIALQSDWDLWPADQGRRERLIDSWVAAYPGNLAPTLHLGTFHANAAITPRAGMMASGESAVPDLVKPSRLIVYTKSLDVATIRNNRWRTDGSPNVFVRRQFWTAPRADYSIPPSSETVPPLLVYGDLAASTDPRVRLAAKEFRTRVS